MSYLTLSRAARLAGVTRGELQRRIRRGDIETFEGSVAVHDLLRLYPEVSLSNDEALARVERIRDRAVPEAHATDAVLPSPQVLVSRLKSLSDTLVDRLSALGAAETLLDEVGDRLNALRRGPQEALAPGLRETLEWLGDARRGLAARPIPDLKALLFAKDTYLRIMAANVKLIPSGHDFFVEGSESILEAAVRAGIMLGYGCANGNCGACKARVVGGEVWRMRPHDYMLSEREKGLGYVLTCCHTAVTDVVLEAAEAHSAADLPRQEIRASLRQLEPIGPQLVSLNIQTPRTRTLRFIAGQRARLTLEDGASRELPIASCPCNGRNLWFYVRAGSDRFSAGVFGGLRPGQSILVEGPMGSFMLREDAPEPSVFLAVGDGIGPIKSLIEHAVSIDLIESFHLYWATDYPEGHYHGGWGRALKESLDNFGYTQLATADPQTLIDLLRRDLPDLGSARFYLAGPADRVGPIRSAIERLGLAAERLAIEHTES